MLAGETDAIAGAALQGQLDMLASAAGTTISSAELLAGETTGTVRRIGLRLAVGGPWPAVVGLLAAIDRASPRMLVDDLRLQPVASVNAGGGQSIAATFTVLAFRAASGA